jgi:hypothetical protein
MNLLKSLLVSLALLIPASHALSAQAVDVSVKTIDQSTINYERNKTRLRTAIDASIHLVIIGGSILWGTNVYETSADILTKSTQLSKAILPILRGRELSSGLFAYIFGNICYYRLVKLRWPAIKNNFHWSFASDEQWQERLEKAAKFKADLEKYKILNQK